MAAGWGSVFIGVAPDDSTSWNGYGLLNYRATQAFGTETIYGSYFGVNDTVGVLLNMDFGTISFFKDGEDFNAGRVNVVNMGVAYHNMRKTSARFSSGGSLYPCLGVKSQGDQLSILKSHWVSQKGLPSNALLERVLYANSLIHSWSVSYRDPSARLTDDFLHRMYSAYKIWRRSDVIPIKSRPGIVVHINTSKEAIATAVGSDIADKYQLVANMRIHTQYGDGTLLGAKDYQLWYSYDLNSGGDNNNWYWRKSEIVELLDSGVISFSSSNDNTVAAKDSAESSSPTSASSALEAKNEVTTVPLSEEDFKLGLCGSPWSLAEDQQVCLLVNSLAHKKDIDPVRISAADVENVIARHSLFASSRSPAEVQARYTALCTLNKAVSLVLPFIDFNRGDSRVPILCADLTPSPLQTDNNISSENSNDSSNSSGSSRCGRDRKQLEYSRLSSTAAALVDIKQVIFMQTKMAMWSHAVRETTTPTGAPPDEYERPEDLKEININRVEARNAISMNIKDSLTFAERMRISVFGQLKVFFRIFEMEFILSLRY